MWSQRLRGRAPRLAFYGVVFILAFAGLRGVLSPAAETVESRPVAEAQVDVGAWSFAEAFARVYLSWEEGDEGEREEQLLPFLPSALDSGAGLVPASGTAQTVAWTAVTGVETRGDRTNVVIAARTSTGTVQLSVPVERTRRGFLFIAGYPAIVGPPVADDGSEIVEEDSVEDAKLEAVVDRAVRNYLDRSGANLMADLTPGAVVSLPNEALPEVEILETTWVVPRRRVAVAVAAADARGTEMSLRYELGVRKLDRWYVSSFQVDPTFQGGS